MIKIKNNEKGIAIQPVLEPDCIDKNIPTENPVIDQIVGNNFFKLIVDKLINERLKMVCPNASGSEK